MNETVKQYKQHGLSTLPVKQDKSPASRQWLSEVDLSEFDNCYGIGIKCGKASGGLECIDFDNHFADAKKIIADFISNEQVKQIYDKYKLPIASTVSGGYHLLFRCEKNEGNQKLAQRPKWNENRWIPDTIIETRGEGGYFVAEPTPGYKVIRNSLSDMASITPEERGILINIAKSFNEWNEPKETQFEEREKPGNYYNTKSEAIDDVENVLLKAGWKKVNTHGWRRPGKKEGISATFGKVAENVFYVFTSNAYPFEPESGYKPFQVVGLLEYGGDFKKFASDLAEKYQLSTPDTYNKKPDKPKEKIHTPKELDDILSKCYIDVSIPVEKPPVIMYINHGVTPGDNFKRLLTLSNISCLTGKSKSKKTFLLTKIISTFGKNTVDQQNKFLAELPNNKRTVLHFDTEQSEYDAYVTGKRIHDMAGINLDHVGLWGLREYKPKERLRIITHAVEKFSKSTGIMFIDGVADLVRSINSEEEADEILHLFMKWTKIYNIHICAVLHQNKKDNFATGWIGTQIMKKAELVMAVEKDPEENNCSMVSCDVIRGVEDFKDFHFEIDEQGFPVITNERINF